jgi:hypothetical protein
LRSEASATATSAKKCEGFISKPNTICNSIPSEGQ